MAVVAPVAPVAPALAEEHADSTRATPSAAAAREAARSPADSIPPPLPPRPAWIAVTTRPPGLRVLVGTVEAGWSPTPPVEISAGSVSVRAFPADLRRFDPSSEGVTLDAAPGKTIRVFLDLRPHPMIRTVPPASLHWLSQVPGAAPDTVLGTTPLRVAPFRLERGRVRFEAAGHADTVVSGEWLMDREDGTLSIPASGPAPPILLRSLGLPPPAPPPGPSLLGRKWLHWALIGTGSLLSGGASILRHEGDRSYDRYLAATDPRVIEREYDRTLRYDRWSAATLGAGQVMLTSGLFLLVTGLGR